ncbi:ABC transporter permease [Lautropia mirabilis]|jgi:ABC-2 type transporter|uniref:ABC transporter permease n=1 Tax=Lautropia mirabilis TaxID=47671 RepID=UPI0028D23920|nr:ABC transporter permease [Lautropia mirabilis]
MRATGFWRRLWALVKKEFRQMLRDRSNLLVGLALPVTLILLFGYGMSFDVKDVRVAMVLEDASPRVQQVLAGLRGSTYMEPRWAGSMSEAEQWLRRHEVEAILRVPPGFSGRLQNGDAKVQLVVNGSESTSAATIESYVNGVLALWAQKEADRAGPAGQTTAAGSVQVQQRLWFNEAGESTWFLVPGLLVLVLTLIGAFLTSLLIAREWERGTMESLFVTPVRPLEIVLAKLIPYVGIGLVDLAMCLLAAHFLFEVPMRGSLGMMVVGGMLYLVVSLLMGLFISGRTRNQFLASQVALLGSLLPSMMLSGFIFDLRNSPQLVQVTGHLLPATHFMGLAKSLFLMGNHWPTIMQNLGILLIYAVLLLWATLRTVRKRLD